MGDTWTLFDRLADRYDQVVPFFAGFAEQAVEVLDPPVGTRMLDIGAGRGAIAIAAASRGCVVTAVDAAPRMVDRLKATAPEIDARTMDAHSLELPDDAYDVAIGGFVIHLVSDSAVVLSEARRVVRPGGTVVMTVPGPCDDGGRWNGFHALSGEFESKATGPGRMGHRFDVAEAMRAAGLVDVRSENVEVHIPITDPQTCWDFHMSHGFASFVEAMSPADAAEFRDRVLAEFATMHADGGIILDRGSLIYIGQVPDHD